MLGVSRLCWPLDFPQGRSDPSLLLAYLANSSHEEVLGVHGLNFENERVSEALDDLGLLDDVQVPVKVSLKVGEVMSSANIILWLLVLGGDRDGQFWKGKSFRFYLVVSESFGLVGV